MPVKKIGPTTFLWMCPHGDASGEAKTAFDAEKALNKHKREEHNE